jgi:hypothetical protein
MRNLILISLLFFQSFIACQQVQEKAFPLADHSINSIMEAKSVTPKAPLTAKNIIFQSIDVGLTWQDISSGLPINMDADYFLIQQDEIIAGNPNGLYRNHITSIVPNWDAEMLLDKELNGIFTGRDGAYSLNNTRNKFSQNITKELWAPVFPNLKIQSIRTIFESKDGIILVGCDNGIYKSIDKGKTWKQVFEIGWVIKIIESNGVLICTNEKGILRSNDGGEHWDLVISEGGVGINVEAIEGGFAAITYNTTSKTRRIRITSDMGKTWQPIDAELPPSANISSIKKVGDLFFCGHPDGIFRSADQGKTWELIFPSIDKKVFNLFVSDKVIYAIPRNGGC